MPFDVLPEESDNRYSARVIFTGVEDGKLETAIRFEPPIGHENLEQILGNVALEIDEVARTEKGNVILVHSTGNEHDPFMSAAGLIDGIQQAIELAGTADTNTQFDRYYCW